MADTIPIPPNRIEDKAPKPKGVIPKNAQSLVIIGVAVLMILIMWLTGGGKKAALAPTPATPPPPPITPTDTSKVEAFRQAIQAEQQQAIDARQPQAGTSPAVPENSLPVNSYPPVPGQTPAYPVVSPSGMAAPPGQEAASQPAPDPIKADEKRREYQSLFASNVALTYRNGEAAEKLSGSPVESPFGGPGPAPGEPPTLSQAQALRDAAALAAMGPPLPWSQPAQARHENSAAEKQPAPAGQQATKPETKAVNPDVAQPGEFNSARGKKYVLFEGTFIPTVLMNRLNGSFAGPVNCLVTHDVYSHDRQHVLIPAGSRVLGEADRVNAFGQERLAVFFHRLIMPDGYSVSLDQFKGLDQEGATALHDKVNNHYTKIFGASLAVGLLGGISGLGTAPILSQSYLDQMRMGFGESMAMTGEQIMNRFLNLMPTITIREGTRVEVYLSNDLLLPDDSEHTMPSDL
jgi:type IV secretory pathway VirB10-like protein